MDYCERRGQDCYNENVGRAFLEQVLFNHHKGSNYKPVNNKEKQIAGIDFEFDGKDGYHYKCDLKVIASTTNREDKLHTACLEILNRYRKADGEWVNGDGWFGHWLKGKSQANSLAILWVDKANTDANGKPILTPTDINEAELCIVRYDKLWENRFEKQLKWTKEGLYQTAFGFIGHEQDIFNKKTVNNTIFCSSKKYYDEERPITILVGRYTYRKNASYSRVYKRRKEDGVLVADKPNPSDE